MTVPALAPAEGVTLSGSYDLLITFLLVMARIMAFLVIAPPFNGRGVPMRVKGALAGAVALAVSPGLAGTARFDDMFTLAWAVVYQLGTGAVLGFLALLLMSAVQTAGDLVDLFSMFTMSQLLDPMSNTQSGVFGRIQNLVGTTLLFASGGHLIMIQGLLRGFRVAPLQPPALGEAAERLVRNLGTYLVSALEICGPIVAVLVLADIALGLVSRAVPSLNIFQLAFPVKTRPDGLPGQHRRGAAARGRRRARRPGGPRHGRPHPSAGG
jgi:flagellar biosynthetic protein FliR